MAKKLEGEWVFLNLENGVYYGLNETGSLIWDKLLKEKSPEALADSLEGIFPVGRARLEKDVQKFLANLEQEGLIATEESPS